MSTTTVKTIGTTGDYSTIQAWEDAAPANLVTSIAGGEIWEGRLQNQTFTAGVTFAGSTTDATGYKHLTCVTGASFTEHASVQTNALRYNASNGAAINFATAYANAVNMTENYARMTGVQVQATAATGAPINAANTGVVIDRCILEGAGNACGNVTTGASLRNSLVVNRKATACLYILNVNFDGSIYGSTLVCTAATGTAAIDSATGTNVLENTAIFNVTAVKSGAAAATYTNCFTSAAAPPSGCTNVGYDTTTGSGFENITNGTHDFRIKGTSALVNAGTTSASFGTPDIAKTARPSGVSYDVGAWEYISPTFIACTDKTQSVFQRVGSSKVITFSGTYGGAAPSSIELQLYKAVDSSVLVAYTPLVGATIGGGTWSATYLVPAASYYYNFSVRSKDSGGTVLATSTQTSFAWGVGAIVSCIGQSNMAQMFGNTTFSPSVSNPTRQYTTVSGWKQNTGAGAVELADKLAAGIGVVVGLLNFGYNNTGLYAGGSEHWLTTTPGSVYDRYLTGLTAVGSDCEAVLWFQGEADAQVPVSKTNYKAALDTLFGRIKTATGRAGLLFGSYFLGRYTGTLSASLNDTDWDVIRQGHLEWTRDTAGAFVATSGVDLEVSGDFIHWTSAGQTRAGKRAAQAYLKELGLVAYGADGPRITGASTTGAVVTLIVTHDGGSALKEVDGTTDGGSLTGFELSTDNFATTLTISSTAFVGGGIQITLSSVPSGAVKLRYQYGINPVVTNAVYDNTTPQSDTIGLPLQPTNGQINAPAGELAGTATLSGITASGGMAGGVGIVTTPPFQNTSGTVMAATTIQKVTLLRHSDMSVALNLTSQVTDGSGVLTISNVALFAGTKYLVVSSNADASAYGCEPVTAT